MEICFKNKYLKWGIDQKFILSYRLDCLKISFLSPGA